MEKFSLKPYDENTKILISHIEKEFGTLIDIIEPIYYFTPIVGHEVLTYNIKKLYFATEIVFTGIVLTLVPSIITAYDNNNVINMQASNNAILFDAVLNNVNYYDNPIILNHALFSRIATIGYAYFKMIGYKITLK